MSLWPGDTFHWAQEARHARKFLVSFGTRPGGLSGTNLGKRMSKRLIEGLCWEKEDLELRYSFLSSLAREMFLEPYSGTLQMDEGGTRCDLAPGGHNQREAEEINRPDDEE